MIPTRVHGILDYIVGIALIAVLWLFGFANAGSETWIPVLLGAGSILYSLITNYEMGVTGILSMKAHLFIDILAGLFLAVSPWLLEYADHVWLPHVVVGAFMVISGIATSRIPRRTPVTSQGHNELPHVAHRR